MISESTVHGAENTIPLVTYNRALAKLVRIAENRVVYTETKGSQ